ncbi:MAG: GntR family transcriptional regulator [Atopobiaceae bacterium]|nr:GntR family transcriptional regulator [Atopobiaceae bacterium]MDD3177846.1 GntR family transcriptional regulator [Atopobiaceae bacterium]MDD3485365.1 GntR family transcriptional regulator [Atopobiaceae bacterium]MDD4380580.1 GntR family transcriptional regulator [Atopobiaceae bacterium]
MHKYEQVVADIKAKIADGTYPCNDLLPSAQKLCERYGVSKITITRAMDQLEVEGLIVRRKGSGSFVKALIPKMATTASGTEISCDMGGFYAQQTAMGKKVRTEVEEFTVAAPPDPIAKSLGMEPDEFAYYMCRLRISDDVHLTVEYTYMPIKLFPDLRRHDAETSLFAYIRERTDYTIASSNRVVRAAKPTPEECRLLEVPSDEPLLEIEQVEYLTDGRPFTYTRSRHAHGAEFMSVGME